MKSGKTSGPDCKYRVTDVIEGTDVQFQIRAENEAGAGHASEPTEILTIEDPTGLSYIVCCVHLSHEQYINTDIRRTMGLRYVSINPLFFFPRPTISSSGTANY